MAVSPQLTLVLKGATPSQAAPPASKEPPMIRARVDFHSESLAMGTSMEVLLPQPTAGQIGMSGAPVAPDALPPVLYLLHGLSDDCTIWGRRTSIERYASAAGLSGVTDLGARFDASIWEGHLRERVWADRGIAGTVDDIPGLLRATAPGTLPRLLLSCGTEDVLIEQNRAVMELAEELGHDITARLVPGTHDWALWDREIQAVIDWLPIRTRG